MSRESGRRESPKGSRTESATENKPPGWGSPPCRARVKRGGKSSPLRGRPRRHGKPRAMQDKQGKGRLPAGSPGISRIRFVKTNGRAERLTAVRVRKMTAQPALAGGQNLAYRTWSAPVLFIVLFSSSLFRGRELLGNCPVPGSLWGCMGVSNV